MMPEYLSGASTRATMVPPHALLDDLHLALSHLVYDHTTKPQQLVDAMACVASIVKHMGPPTAIVKNPYKG